MPLLTGKGRSHHGEILQEATKLAEAGKLVPLIDRRSFTMETIEEAYKIIELRIASGKVVVDI
jgi:NADPH:quinone reductase-like Zn-dependent oxidoreductase